MEPHMIEETRSCDINPWACPVCGELQCSAPMACFAELQAPDDLPVPPPLVGASAPAVLPEGELSELRKDKARLEWLSESNTITPEQASMIVNGHSWNGAYRGSIRAAIDAAMEASDAA